MKEFWLKVWRRISDWVTGPDLDLEKFESLESKKVIQKGVRSDGEC